MGNHISSKDIHLIIVDTKANWDMRVNDGFFTPDPHFKSARSVEKAEELKQYLETLGKDDYVLLYVHAFRNQNEWVPKLTNKIEQIKFLLGDTTNIKIVTSDETAIVKDKFPSADVDMYNDIVRKARSNNYHPQTVGEVLGTPVSDSKRNVNAGADYIFISHSSKDKQIVTAFTEKLLRLGLNFDRDSIFYTSDYATGLKAGNHIPAELKGALKRMTIFIQFISKNYRESEVCLNEMGAAWYKLDPHSIITLLIPPANYDEVGFIHAQNIGIKLTDRENMFKLFDEYKHIFQLKDAKAGEFANKLDLFISQIKKITKPK